MKKFIIFSCIFLKGIHKAILLQLIGNGNGLSIRHGLVVILSQKVYPPNYSAFLFIGRYELSEGRFLVIICELFNFAFFNKPKFPLLGHSRIDDVFWGKDNLFHNMSQFELSLSLKDLHYLIFF